MDDRPPLFPTDSSIFEEPQGRPSTTSSNSKTENSELNFYSKLENFIKEQSNCLHDSIQERISFILDEKLETLASQISYSGQSISRAQILRFNKSHSDPIEITSNFEKQIDNLTQSIKQVLSNYQISHQTSLTNENEQLRYTISKLTQENETLSKTNEASKSALRDLNEKIKIYEEDRKGFNEKMKEKESEIRNLNEEIKDLHGLVNKQNAEIIEMSKGEGFNDKNSFKEVLTRESKDILDVKKKLEDMNERILKNLKQVNLFQEKETVDKIGFSEAHGFEGLESWKNCEEIIEKQIQELEELEREFDDMGDLDEMLLFFRQRNMSYEDFGTLQTFLSDDD
jgi:chromosome segregation ATPase